MTRISILALCLLSLPAVASAQGSLTTLFGSNNGLSASGSGQMFDLEVTNPSGLKITSFDVNSTIAAGSTPVTIDIYVTRDTYVNNDTTPDVWVQVSTGTGPGQGRDVPTPIDTDDFFLAPGRYGIYILYTNPTGLGVGPRYTNGTGSNQSYSNADLKLDLGISRSTPWGGSRFDPRVWNGTIYYDADDKAASGKFGPGCAGSNGMVPDLSMSADPALGMTTSFDVANLINTTTTGLLLLGAPKQDVDLTPLGMPGCFLRVTSLLSIPIVNINGSATFPVSIPNTPSLVGDFAHIQAAIGDPTANGLGLVASNGLSFRIGN